MSDCLSLRGVCKSYHAGIRGCSATISVLRDIDLDVTAGEIVGISALPAAGKTTLLMCAAGLLRPDRGSVSWFGGPPCRDGAAKPDGIAYASDRPFPYGFLSVREALEYAAIVRDLPLRDSADRVARALDRTGLAAIAHRRVDALGASALARFAIAGGILSDPRLLLVDDVSSGCDAATAEELLAVIRCVASEGASVIIAGRLVPWLATASSIQPPGDLRLLSLAAGRLDVARDSQPLPARRPNAGVTQARVAEFSPTAAARQNGGR